jgi:fructose-bisphosphate aldolase class 1
MITHSLLDTARALVADDKGLLAIDESHPTCNKRFAKLGIPQTEEARRAYRELLIRAPGLGESISGVILFDETIRRIRSTVRAYQPDCGMCFDEYRRERDGKRCAAPCPD